MIALNLQYTAFKEMLIAECDNFLMVVSGINNHGKGNGAEIYFSEPIPSKASEAYLFAPPGYWKSVYNNEIYPDDFPTNLLPSMSGGATTATIPGSYTDGHYLMLYYIWDIWRQVDIEIKDNTVIKVNNFNVANIPEDIVHTLGDNLGFHSEIYINSAVIENVDSDITVSIIDGKEIDSELIVKYDRQNDINSEIFVWFKDTTDIDSEIWINDSKTLDSELIVKYDCENNLDSEITVKRNEIFNIDSEIFVWFGEQKEIESDILITHSSYLDNEITIKRIDKSDIDSEINIQVFDGSDLDSEITVYVYGTGNKLFLSSEITAIYTKDTNIDSEIVLIESADILIDSNIEVTKKQENISVNSAIEIIQKDYTEIQSEIIILSNILMESITDITKRFENILNSEIEILYYCKEQIDSSMTIVCQNTVIETIYDIVMQAYSDCNSEITILINKYENIDSEINIVSNMCIEAIADIYLGEKTQIDNELTIALINNSNIDSEINIIAPSVIESVTDVIFGSVLYLNSEITVAFEDFSQLASEINITSIILMQSTVDTIFTNRSDIDSEIVIAFNNNSDLLSEIIIPANTLMRVVSDNTFGGFNDLNSNICVVYKNIVNIDAEIMVNATNTMENIVFYRNNAIFDIDSSITLSIESQIESEIYVTYKDLLMMEVAGNILPAVLKHNSVEAIKDTVCYSLTALTNYGTLPEISMGKFKGGETFKSLLGFDLTSLDINRGESYPYFGYEVIQKAIIKLYVTRPMVEENVIIKVYRTSYEWLEKYANYRLLDTLPIYELVTEFVAPSQMGEIEIDVTKAFIDWNNKLNEQSFIFVVENQQDTNKGLYVSSREGRICPKLEIDYYKTLSNGYWSDLECTIEINPNSNINSEITVCAPCVSFIESEIDIVIQEQKAIEFEAEIDIVANNIDSLLVESEIFIIGYPCDVMLNNELDILYWTINQTLESEIDVIRDPLFGHYIYII